MDDEEVLSRAANRNQPRRSLDSRLGDEAKAKFNSLRQKRQSLYKKNQ